jgi:allophanate hydrolase
VRVTARLEIVAAGPLTSVQDTGRRGFMRFGVTRAGPVDRAAHALANAAVGNAPGAAAIELSQGGASLVCHDAPLGFALAGGGFTATLDGRPLGSWIAGTLQPGQRLVIRDTGAGNWAVLALAGALVAPEWLGSRATHSQSGLGGGLLSAGTIMRVESPREVAAGPIDPWPVAAGEARLLPGPQDRFFEPAALQLLLSQPFRAGSAFDRMGRQLDGPALVPTRLDMPSEPTMRGALQLDGTGRLTLLLADHQTTGGYPRIGCVIDPDIDALAQLPAGTPIRFRAVSRIEAQAAARAAAAGLEAAVAAARTRLSPLERLLQCNLIDGAVDATSPD